MDAVVSLMWKRANAALRYDYLSITDVSVHPQWTVLHGLHAAGQRNGWIHKIGVQPCPCPCQFLTFLATGRT